MSDYTVSTCGGCPFAQWSGEPGYSKAECGGPGAPTYDLEFARQVSASGSASRFADPVPTLCPLRRGPVSVQLAED